MINITTFIRKFLLTLNILLLFSCSFKPVYDTRDYKTHNKNLNAIQIEPISTISGAEIYHTLSTYFPLKSKPKYLLKITISYYSRPQAIQKNSDVFREIVTQITNYQLLDITSAKILTSGNFTLSSSYNTSFSPYGSYIENMQTNQNLANYSAQQIRQRLILYFTKEELPTAKDK